MKRALAIATAVCALAGAGFAVASLTALKAVNIRATGFVPKNVTVAGLKNPIIGRGVIVHAKMDDGGQPVGNAGARIACGVIGVANSGK